MAQVNLIQYAEISTGSGSPLSVGSKTTPSTIAMTGTGEIVHRVYNDIAGTTAQVLYDNNFGSGIPVWWAIKSSQTGTVGFGNDSTEASAIGVVAGVWQFFNSGRGTTSVSTTVSTKASGSLSTIGDIVFYNRSASVADVEFIAVV